MLACRMVYHEHFVDRMRRCVRVHIYQDTLDGLLRLGIICTAIDIVVRLQRRWQCSSPAVALRLSTFWQQLSSEPPESQREKRIGEKDLEKGGSTVPLRYLPPWIQSTAGSCDGKRNRHTKTDQQNIEQCEPKKGRKIAGAAPSAVSSRAGVSSGRRRSTRGSHQRRHCWRRCSPAASTACRTLGPDGGSTTGRVPRSAAASAAPRSVAGRKGCHRSPRRPAFQRCSRRR